MRAVMLRHAAPWLSQLPETAKLSNDTTPESANTPDTPLGMASVGSVTLNTIAPSTQPVRRGTTSTGDSAAARTRSAYVAPAVHVPLLPMKLQLRGSATPFCKFSSSTSAVPSSSVKR